MVALTPKSSIDKFDVLNVNEKKKKNEKETIEKVLFYKQIPSFNEV